MNDLLDGEFHPGDDTYKGVAKDIHALYLDRGWRSPLARQEAGESLRWIAKEMREVLGDPGLVELSADGVTPSMISVADWLEIIAINLTGIVEAS